MAKNKPTTPDKATITDFWVLKDLDIARLNKQEENHLKR